MKRLIFLFAAGVVALALILIHVPIAPVPCGRPSLPCRLRFPRRRMGLTCAARELIAARWKLSSTTRKWPGASGRCASTPRQGFQRTRSTRSCISCTAPSDETGWVKDGAADTILDNLYEDKKPVPMIVVMPNGNLPTDALGTDLLDDVIPYVEKHFPVKADREHRALAGVSGGALQTLNLGPPTRTRLPTSASSSAAWITATGSRRSTKRCSRIWGRKRN